MRTWVCVPLTILLFLGTACSGKHGLSKAERQEARNRELQSFASANSAALVPDIKGSAVTLDWQKALRGPIKVYAFRGWVDDIFEKGGKYFLNVSDMDDKLLWIIQCSEAEAEDVRSQHNKIFESLLLVEVGEIRPVTTADSSTEVTGTLRKFQPSKAPF